VQALHAAQNCQENYKKGPNRYNCEQNVVMGSFALFVAGEKGWIDPVYVYLGLKK
jgi:hypothetical protein